MSEVTGLEWLSRIVDMTPTLCSSEVLSSLTGLPVAHVMPASTYVVGICEHEHKAEGPVCDLHVTAMDKMLCFECSRAPDGRAHMCPVKIVEKRPL